MQTLLRRPLRAFFLLAGAAALAVLAPAAPSITTQPGTVIATAGADAAFSVFAEGTGPLGYQWRHLGVPIAGATGPTFTVETVADSDAGFYDVVVSEGAESVVSAPARLWIAAAADADCYRVDPGFNFVAESSGAGATCITPASGGGVLVGGWFTTITGVRRDGLARYTAALVLDPAFAPVVAGEVDAIVELADGKILIGGGFTHVNGVPRAGIARLNSDGSLDTGFDPGAGFNGNVFALLVSDGKIVAGGAFTEFDGQSCGRIARLTADGSLDPTFAAGSGFDATVRTLARQSAGKFVVGGSFSTFSGNTVGRLARLESSGAFDPTFDTGAGCNADVMSIAVLDGDALLLGGSFTDFDGATVYRVARLGADGARDTTFGTPSTINGGVRAVAPAGSGKFWIAGEYTGVAQRGVTRLNADGSIDATWLPSAGERPNTTVTAVAPRADGGIYAVGLFTQLGTVANSASGVVSYGATGSVASAPAGAFLRNAEVFTAAPAPGGGWYIGGSFTRINGVGRNRIARISAAGQLDFGFDPGIGFNSTVKKVACQGDGALLVAGSFSSYNGTVGSQVVRLLADGSRDAAFALDSRVTGTISDIAVQSDGRIVVAGLISTNYGGTRNSVARIFADGALDESFDVGPLPSGSVATLALADDGTFWAGGGFTSLGGVARARAARLGTTGALTGFNAGAGFDAVVNAVATRPDGSCVVGGAFSTWEGAAAGRLAGFSSTGARLGAFNSGEGFSGGNVLGLAALADGRVLASGTFDLLGGLAANGLARFDADGGVDTDFRVFGLSIGANGAVRQLGDGRLLVLEATGAGIGGRQIGLVVLEPIARHRYAGWAAANFSEAEQADAAIGGALADPDGAGLPNMLRYAFGTPARGPVVAPTTTEVVLDGGARYLAIRFDRRADADDLVYTVQASSDLTAWTDIEVVGPGAPTEQMVRDLVPLSGAPRRFLRVAVELVP